MAKAIYYKVFFEKLFNLLLFSHLDLTSGGNYHEICYGTINRYLL